MQSGESSNDNETGQSVCEGATSHAPGGMWRWTCAGALSGAAMGVSTVFAVVVVYAHGKVGPANPSQWLAFTFASGLIASIPGACGGALMGAFDTAMPIRASRPGVAAILGGLFGMLALGLWGQFVAGLIVGMVAGFCAGVWVARPGPLPYEATLPLRGRRLWIAVTLLMIAVTPQVVLAALLNLTGLGRLYVL